MHSIYPSAFRKRKIAAQSCQEMSNTLEQLPVPLMAKTKRNNNDKITVKRAALLKGYKSGATSFPHCCIRYMVMMHLGKQRLTLSSNEKCGATPTFLRLPNSAQGSGARDALHELHARQSSGNRVGVYPLGVRRTSTTIRLQQQCIYCN